MNRKARYAALALTWMATGALAAAQAASAAAPAPAAASSSSASSASPAASSAAPKRERPAPASAAEASVVVLAAHPVVFALTEALAKDSGVRVQRAAPERLPATRLLSYFSGRGEAALSKAAAGADAVVGLRSIWPEDPLYPMARRSNIRIIEIDAARPVDGALAGIALQAGERDGGAFAAYPWLSMVNLGRMADIIAADLVRLSPADAPTIETHLAAIKRRLITLNAQSQAALAMAENVSVVSLSERMPYLVSAFNLDLVDTLALDDAQWTPDALASLTAMLRDNGVAATLLHRDPTPELRQAIEAGGAKVVVLQTEGADPVGELEANAKLLEQALAP